MLYVQIAVLVINFILGIARERPMIQNQAMLKADEISRMEIQWQHRGNDQHWVYYSDQIGRYWCRVNRQGIREYSENPQYM